MQRDKNDSATLMTSKHSPCEIEQKEKWRCRDFELEHYRCMCNAVKFVILSQFTCLTNGRTARAYYGALHCERYTAVGLLIKNISSSSSSSSSSNMLRTTFWPHSYHSADVHMQTAVEWLSHVERVKLRQCCYRWITEQLWKLLFQVRKQLYQASIVTNIKLTQTLSIAGWLAREFLKIMRSINLHSCCYSQLHQTPFQ